MTQMRTMGSPGFNPWHFSQTCNRLRLSQPSRRVTSLTGGWPLRTPARNLSRVRFALVEPPRGILQVHPADDGMLDLAGIGVTPGLAIEKAECNRLFLVMDSDEDKDI
jgi:hypothetical protein